MSRYSEARGRIVTLPDALVFEGLADHFAEEIFPDLPSRPWWRGDLTQEQESILWQRVRPHLRSDEPLPYDYTSWFIGGADFPPYAGYKLGYRIVAAYLRGARKASAAVADPTGEIIAPYRAHRE